MSIFLQVLIVKLFDRAVCKFDACIYASKTTKEMTIFKEEKHWYYSHCYSDKGTVVNRTCNSINGNLKMFHILLKGKSFFNSYVIHNWSIHLLIISFLGNLTLVTVLLVGKDLTVLNVLYILDVYMVHVIFRGLVIVTR